MRSRWGCRFFFWCWLARFSVAIAAEPGESPEVHHARALSAAEAGRWGVALAELRRTETLLPWDREVQVNLQRARAKLDQPAPTNPLRWLAGAPPNLLAGMLLAAVWLWATTVAATRWLRPQERLWVWPKWIFGAATLLAALLLVSAWIGRRFTPDGVVTAKDAILRQGPVEAAKAQGAIPEGAEVRVLREHQGWHEIGWLRPGSSALGWLPPGQLAPVAPPWWPAPQR